MLSKISLSLSDVLSLEAELNGFVNPSNGEVILEGFLKEKHPSNQHIPDKIRQQLQQLRDLGLIEFLGNGRYKKLWK